MTQPIAIYGAGGFAREVAWLIEECNAAAARYETVCFIDDNTALHGNVLNGITVLGLDDAYTQYPDARVVSGMGSPRARETTMMKAAARGFGTATLIHPHVRHSRWNTYGAGSVICAGNILTVNITLGQHVQINLDCTIGHDAVLDDYATLAPGVHVSGWVHIGKRAYIGTGANIINGTQDAPLVIGADAVIGAGACVTKSIPPGVTAVGIPAKPLQPRKE